MRERKWMGLLIAVVFLFCSGLAVAEEQSSRAHRLDDVVVSATRTEIPVADAPQSVTVISQEEIMASPFERVEDILRFNAGIYNTSHYGVQTGGIMSHLNMRGTGRNRLLMLLDGVPLNDNFNNSIAWVAWGLIPKETIQRIEIVRGPSSASYGSEGLGGVINIITKRPVEERETTAGIRAGSGKTHKASALHSQKIDRTGFLVSGSLEKSDGFYAVDPEQIEELTLKRYRDVEKAFGKGIYSLSDKTEISLSGLYYEHEMGKGREFFYDDLQLDQYRLGITYKGDFMDWTGMVYLNRADKTAYQDQFIRRSNTYVPNREERFPENIVWGAELQNTAHLFDTVTLTSGLAYKNIDLDYEEKYLTSDRDAGAEGQQESVSPFLDITARFFEDRLIANAGIRYDNIKNFDGKEWDTDPDGNVEPFDNSYSSERWDQFSPKAGLVFHPDGLSTLRTSVGTGFRAPSLFELYKTQVRGGGRSRTLANPELDPEKIVTWEIGAERYFFNNLLARITYYYSWADDYIASRTIDRTTIDGARYVTSRRDNLEEVEIEGVETELQYYFGYGVSTFFNYTYNTSEITKNEENPALEGNYLTNNPKHKYRGGITYRNPGLINGSVVFQHDRDLYLDDLNTDKAPNITTLDLSVWKTFLDFVTLRFDVENLTDEEDYFSEGVLYYGSIRFDF